MKILIVEDDFTSRKVLTGMLKEYGECDVAADGLEAIDAFKDALKAKIPYDLVCLDIMMPKMDGQDVLRTIRATEEKENITGLDSVKIIMTTALDDKKNILDAFNAQCEVYIVKPINKEHLVQEMKKLGLV